MAGVGFGRSEPQLERPIPSGIASVTDSRAIGEELSEGIESKDSEFRSIKLHELANTWLVASQKTQLTASLE